MSPLKYQSGQLAFRRKSSGAQCGREDWTLVRHEDGSRTLHCITLALEPKLVREVSYTLGSDARPAAVFIRLQAADRPVATGYFRTHGNILKTVTDAAGSGHVAQEVETPPRFHILTHSALIDGWLSWSCELTRGKEQAVTVYHAAAGGDSTASLIGRLKRLRAAFLGEGEVSAPAGVFKARHFRFDSGRGKTPAFEMWVTGKDNILVKAYWDDLDLEYLLTSLRTDPTFDSGRHS